MDVDVQNDEAGLRLLVPVELPLALVALLDRAALLPLPGLGDGLGLLLLVVALPGLHGVLLVVLLGLLLRALLVHFRANCRRVRRGLVDVEVAVVHGSLGALLRGLGRRQA